MDDSFFDRMGYDPVRIFAQIHGHKPTGIARLSPPRPDPEPPELEDQPEDPPEACLGEVAAAPAADGGVGAESADPEPSPAVEHPATADAAPRRSPSPSELGEDLDESGDGEPDPAAGVQAWLTRNWRAIKALDAAGRLPELESPPRDGEMADAKAADEGDAPAGAALEANPLPHPADSPLPGNDLPRPPVHVRKSDRWNKCKMAGFLRQLAATHNIGAAARSVGMSRESAHRLRNRLKGQPFDVAWEAASRHGYDALTDAALDRAINGVEVPHYCNGKLAGTHRSYNEQLTVALLRMRNGQGAPLIGRYGAAAEWMSERWDAALQRIETGSVDWSDERRALSPAEIARLDLPDDKTEIDALIEKHLPEQGHKPPQRR